MRRSLILVGLVLGLPAGALARPGRVVRIERRPFGSTGVPRLCSVSGDGPRITGFCMMGRPDPGALISVLDSARVVATVRVTSASPFNDCNSDTAVWQFTGTIERGDLAMAQGATWGVIDLPIDPRTSHLVTVPSDRSPTGHASGDTIEAVDGDGDGAPDLEFIQFECDDVGNANPTGNGSCLEVWIAAHQGFQRIHHTRARTCY